MRRRVFVAGVLGAAAFPIPLLAQPARTLRVGTANVQAASAPHWKAFARRLAELGYVEGRNLTYDHVQIPNVDAWEALYREVVARKPDIIVAAGPEQSLKAARAAAGDLPIVMIAVDFDPVERGYVASLAKPGSTITGVYFKTVELAAKHLQLMKELSPDMSSATVFWDQLSADYLAGLQVAAAKNAIKLSAVEFRERPYDYERALAAVPAPDRKVLLALASPFFFLDRKQLADFAIRNRMVAMIGSRQSVVDGGLISYSARLEDMWALAASYVDRIAKGTKPADLSVQQPVKFEMLLNLKTARALGIEVSPLLLAQADEVIE